MTTGAHVTGLPGHICATAMLLWGARRILGLTVAKSIVKLQTYDFQVCEASNEWRSPDTGFASCSTKTARRCFAFGFQRCQPFGKPTIPGSGASHAKEHAGCTGCTLGCGGFSKHQRRCRWCCWCRWCRCLLFKFIEKVHDTHSQRQSQQKATALSSWDASSLAVRKLQLGRLKLLGASSNFSIGIPRFCNCLLQHDRHIASGPSSLTLDISSCVYMMDMVTCYLK